MRIEENDDPKTRRRIMQDTSRYTASEENPTLIVQPCVPEVPCAMKASTTYKFRLLINVGETQGYADITLETAGKPPSGRYRQGPSKGKSRDHFKPRETVLSLLCN